MLLDLKSVTVLWFSTETSQGLKYGGIHFQFIQIKTMSMFFRPNLKKNNNLHIPLGSEASKNNEIASIETRDNLIVKAVNIKVLIKLHESFAG